MNTGTVKDDAVGQSRSTDGLGSKALIEKLRSYDTTSGYSRVMRQAADEIERLKLRNTKLNKKARTYELLSIQELKQPATGHDYWENYFKAKLASEIEAMKEMPN